MQKKLLMLLVCTLLLIPLLTGCTSNRDIEQLEEECTAFLEAVAKEDAEAAYALFAESVTREEFDVLFAEFTEVFGGTDRYYLTQLYWGYHDNAENGIRTYSASYFVESENGNAYSLTFQSLEDGGGISAGLMLAPQDTDLTAVNDAHPALRIVLAVLSVLQLCLTVFMVVDCVKRKPDGMLFWILLMLMTVCVTYWGGKGFYLEGAVKTALAFWDVRIIDAVGGSFRLQAPLPVFSAAYFFLRKKLPCKTAETAVAEPETKE